MARVQMTPAEEASGITTLSQDFVSLRPLVYSSRDKCLYDCLVLLEFLAYFDLFPTLVIGVATFPFRAHCWLQYGPLVLTDYVEHTLSYTPILVV
jgi:Transglutaminase-like superfamily